MSYQNLGDNQAYGQYNPYERSNPDANTNTNQHGYGGGYEMGNMNQGSSAGPTGILQKCKEINESITELTRQRESQLVAAQKELLDSSNGKEDQSSRQKLDYIEDEINTALRYLRDQFKRVKETPGSGDSRVQAQVENCSRNLKREIESYQRAQSDFQKRLEEQVRRRYEIANPDATPEELEQGVQNVLVGGEQVFKTSNRSAQANDARQAVLQRSTAIRKIEQDLIELSHLYNEVAQLVEQQDPAVHQISQGAEETHRNVAQANTKLDNAIVSAKNARRWKWYALIIVIIIIAIVVGVAVGVTEANKSVNKSN